MNLPLNHYLPCGLTLVIARMPETAQEHAGQLLWSVEGNGAPIARGYCPDLRSALVCLRWALTSALEKSAREAGALIMTALEGVPL